MKITNEAREAGEEVFAGVLGDAACYSEWGYPSYKENAIRYISSLIQSHINQTVERCAKVADYHADKAGFQGRRVGDNIATAIRQLVEE